MGRCRIGRQAHRKRRAVSLDWNAYLISGVVNVPTNVVGFFDTAFQALIYIFSVIQVEANYEINIHKLQRWALLNNPLRRGSALECADHRV